MREADWKMNAYRLKKSHLKTFVISIISVSAIFASVGTFMIRGIREWSYTSMRKEYLSYTRGHSHGMGKALEAQRIVDGLLNERIMSAAKAISGIIDPDQDDLRALARTIGVNSILIYDESGTVINSADEAYIGFSPKAGHPARDFYDSTLISQVGEIREDSVRGGHVKYGYLRLSAGGFIQVGISEAEIGTMTSGLELDELLKEIKGTGSIRYASYADRDFRIVGSTDENMKGKFLEEDERLAVTNGQILASDSGTDWDRIYRVVVPVYSGGSGAGSLIAGFEIKGTDSLIVLLSNLGMFLLVTIYAVLLFMILSSYRKDKRLWKLAYTDGLTGLPNSLYLKEVLEDKLSRDRNSGIALLMVNLNDFRDISMTLGHETGDRMLKEIAERLEALVKNGITLYRYAADRFVLLHEECRNRNESRAIAMRIDDLFAKPFRLHESFKYLSVQIGISDTEGSRKSADQLLKEASVSLGSIKDPEDSSLAFFDSYMEYELQREEAIEEELSKLLQGEGDGRFYLVFQPMAAMQDDRITGFEALARFESKALGLVMPMEFIRIAERKQIICQLGEVIFREACEFLRMLESSGNHGIKVAVNVSGVQLMRECFAEGVRDIIGRCGADPSMIEIEITESILVEDFEEINERLGQLRNQGIRTHLDDFGTGYSSLHRLKELQVDTLKIDRSFISSIKGTGDNDSIVGDIISMAHRTGLAAVAEGVETALQRDYLKANGCDYYQGYLISKPLLKDKAIELLERKNSIAHETDENQQYKNIR